MCPRIGLPLHKGLFLHLPPWKRGIPRFPNIKTPNSTKPKQVSESIGITRAIASQRRIKRLKTRHTAKSAQFANSSTAKKSTTPSTKPSKTKNPESQYLQNNNPIDLTDDSINPNPIPTETLNYSNLYPSNTLMSNKKMDMVITNIRKFCPHEVYIVESSATTYCRLYTTTWTSI